MADEPTHSPKGASSAERWMNCTGSAVLLKELSFPETDEPEYRGLGKAAHSLASYCLQNGIDTWETVRGTATDDAVYPPGGAPGPGHEITHDMADAVQVYLDYVRPLMTVPATTVMVEQRIGEDVSKRPHPDFYGTVDFSAYSTEHFHVVDYKHGEGIIVEPEDNRQMLYYAYGILHERRLRGVQINPERKVILTIVQPRAYHEDGGIREWETTAGYILNWGETVLLPAMEAAEIDNDFQAGKWCRFCPAKLFCPLLTGLFGAAAKADPGAVQNLNDQRLGLEYDQRDAVKFYMKALEDEVYRRNSTGNTVPGTKLVYKQSRRVFREGAEELFKARLGDAAYEPARLKSPAEMEKVNPVANALVREWAYLPKSGLTVAPLTDKRTAVKVEKVEDTFAHFKTT